MVSRTRRTRRLMPRLNQLITGMLANARTRRPSSHGTPLAEGSEPRGGCCSRSPRPEIKAHAGSPGPRREPRRRPLIAAHDRVGTPRPILGTDIDYSLYTPRGHYTRTKALTRYFLAMSASGQTAFALPGALQNDQTRADASGLRMAALASRTLVGDASLEALWRPRIYEPTAFLLGSMMQHAIRAGDRDRDGAAGHDVRPCRARRRRLDPSRGHRPHGRATGADRRGTTVRAPHGHPVRDRLLGHGPAVGALCRDAGRPTPAAVPATLAAAFGSRFAYGVQRAAAETAYANYDSQMAAMRDAIAIRPDSAWGNTVYDAWGGDRAHVAADGPRSLTSCARGHGPPRTINRASAPTRSSSTTPSCTPSSPWARWAMPGRRRCPGAWVEPDPVPFGRLQAMADLDPPGPGRGSCWARTWTSSWPTTARSPDSSRASRPTSSPASRFPPPYNQRLLRVGGTLEDFGGGRRPAQGGRSLGLMRWAPSSRTSPAVAITPPARSRWSRSAPGTWTRSWRSCRTTRASSTWPWWRLLVLRVPPAGHGPPHR